MTHDEMIAVIQAHRDGKSLQWRFAKGGDCEWKECPPPIQGGAFNFELHYFRIKPKPTKPRDFKLARCLVHSGRWVAMELPGVLNKECPQCEIIHVREVLEETSVPSGG